MYLQLVHMKQNVLNLYFIVAKAKDHKNIKGISHLNLEDGPIKTQ